MNKKYYTFLNEIIDDNIYDSIFNLNGKYSLDKNIQYALIEHTFEIVYNNELFLNKKQEINKNCI